MTGAATPVLLQVQSGHPHAAIAAGLIAYLTALVLGAVWLYVRFGRRIDGPGDDDGGSDGGGGRRRPKPTGPRPDPEPEWWPEFERQFAAYVDSRLTRSR